MALSDREMALAIKKHQECEELLRLWNLDLKVKGALIRDVYCSWRDGRVRLYDEVEPIYKSESLEDVLKKYMRLYPDEATLFINDMNSYKSSLRHDKGMSKLGTQRIVCKLPQTLHAIIDKYFPHYLDDKKGLHSLQQILPKCFVGQI